MDVYVGEPKASWPRGGNSSQVKSLPLPLSPPSSCNPGQTAFCTYLLLCRCILATEVFFLCCCNCCGAASLWWLLILRPRNSLRLNTPNCSNGFSYFPGVPKSSPTFKSPNELDFSDRIFHIWTKTIRLHHLWQPGTFIEIAFVLHSWAST